jgi:hypothetical protein
MKTQKERLGPCLIGLGVLLFYAAFPSYFHNFDGVACAIAVDLGDFRHLFHGNHLLYGFLGFIFHRALNLIGLTLNGLWALQWMDMILGAGGAGYMHLLLRRQGFSPRISAGASVGMALSFGYWMSALEAQVYIAGAFCLLIAFEESLRQKPDPTRLALKHAAAMLIHGSNALFAPAALYALYRASEETSERKKSVFLYLAVSTSVVLIAYFLVGAIVMRPQSWQDLRIWLGGTAALGPDRTLNWHGGTLGSDLSDWIRLCGLVISPSWLLALPVWSLAGWAVWKNRRAPAPTVRITLIFFIPYALFFSRWESNTLHFRVNDLIPLWFFAAYAVDELSKPNRRAYAVLVYAAALAAFNLSGGILKISDPAANKKLQEARWIGRSTPEGAWVAADGIEEVYVPYFGHRKPLILRFVGSSPEAMTERIFSLMTKGDSVFVTSERLNNHSGFPLGLGLREVSRENKLILYQITSIAQ